MKCHVNIKLSTKVCHTLTKKSLSLFSFSSFSFPFFPSFSFCSSLLHFSFFPRHHSPPLVIVFCKIYTPAQESITFEVLPNTQAKKTSRANMAMRDLVRERAQEKVFIVIFSSKHLILFIVHLQEFFFPTASTPGHHQTLHTPHSNSNNDQPIQP